jgi:hypothetical protein
MTALDAPVAAPVVAAAPAAASAPTVFLGLTLAQAIVMLAWPALLLAALYAFYLPKARDLAVLEAAIRSRPALKVVDVSALVRSHIATGLSADAAIDKANADMQRLGRAGYVVIDSNAVMASPPGAELKR